MKSVELKQVVLKKKELKGIKAQDKEFTRGDYLNLSPGRII
jgi:hypothetical protein